MEKLNKLSLPAVILIVSIVLGVFFLASQISKQISTEKQIQAIIKAAENQLRINRVQEQKEYRAKRVRECYSLYLSEKKEWTNVEDYDYSEITDICNIYYLDDKEELWSRKF